MASNSPPAKIIGAEFIYHPEPDTALEYLHGEKGGTLGLKITAIDGEGKYHQYGVWDFVREPWTVTSVLLLATELTHTLLTQMPQHILTEGINGKGPRTIGKPGRKPYPPFIKVREESSNPGKESTTG